MYWDLNTIYFRNGEIQDLILFDRQAKKGSQIKNQT